MFNVLKSGSATDTIPVQTALEMAARDELTLIDIRDISELKATGKARGALHIPLMLLQAKMDPRSPECDPALGVERPVGLYCATGARSYMATQMLSQMGYQAVYNLGGLHDLARAGCEIEPVPGPGA